MSLLGEIDTFLRDIRYGVRLLARKPAFTGAVILTLTLGIGANVAIFSIVDAALFRSLPFRDPGRLVAVWESENKLLNWSKMFVSYRDFERWREDNHDFDSMAAYTWAVRPMRLSGVGEPRNAVVIPASMDFFSMLGVRPMLGRTFEPIDTNSPDVVVLSYRGWKHLFDGAPDIVGKTVMLDERPFTVIGVMPSHFEMYPKETEAWSLLTPASDVVKDPMFHILAVAGRLKRHASADAGRDDLSLIRQRANEQNPDLFKDVGVVVNGLQDDYVWFAGRNLKPALLALFGGVLMVLAIGCLNVANLLLGRGADRRREMAIRAALGSGRARLIRQLLTESTVLSVAGAGLGILCAQGLIQWFNDKSPIELPPDTVVAVSGRVLIFAIALAGITAIFFGLVPAFRATGADLSTALKEAGRASASGRSRRRLSGLLVVSEVALALVLITGASLLTESVVKYGALDLGFRPDNLVTMKVSLSERDYPTAEKTTNFYDRVLEKIKSVPGVESASAVQWLPLESGGGQIGPISIEGRAPATADSPFDVAENRVATGYFQTMDIPLVEGRYLDSRDRAGALETAVASEALVRKYFPDQDPVGNRVKVGVTENHQWVTIVGVVGDVRYNNVFKEMGLNKTAVVYMPLDQSPIASDESPGSTLNLVVRTPASPKVVSGAVGEIVHSLDAGVPLPESSTMRQIMAKTIALPKFRAVLAMIFGGLAMFLAAIGIYGVLSQAVSERTGEIGIRMALGASHRDVLKMVLGEGMGFVVLGIIAGIGGALGMAKLISNLLFGVTGSDPSTLVAAAAILIASAFAACYLPARRAMKVDPNTALRYE
jgi:predicted permease